jgi:hypothetical protein
VQTDWPKFLIIEEKLHILGFSMHMLGLSSVTCIFCNGKPRNGSLNTTIFAIIVRIKIIIN